MRHILTISFLILISNDLLSQQLIHENPKTTIATSNCPDEIENCNNYITSYYNNYDNSLKIINHGISKTIVYVHLININTGEIYIITTDTQIYKSLDIHLNTYSQGDLYEAQILYEYSDQIGFPPITTSYNYRFYY